MQFLYKLGTCADAATSTLATGTVAEISYRDSQGPVQSQTIPLKAGRLRLLGPTGVDCVPRPYSHIGLVGSFTTKPGHKPVVGSDGDTCFTSRNGDFVYTSRYLRDRTGIRFRVKIILSRLAGKGLYTAAPNPAARGRAHISVTGGFGDRGSIRSLVNQAQSPSLRLRLRSTAASSTQSSRDIAASSAPTGPGAARPKSADERSQWRASLVRRGSPPAASDDIAEHWPKRATLVREGHRTRWPRGAEKLEQHDGHTQRTNNPR